MLLVQFWPGQNQPFAMNITSLYKRLSTAHGLRLALLYVIGLALLAPIWREADVLLFSKLSPPVTPALRKEILVIDIDRPPGQEDALFRRQLGSLLASLASRTPVSPKAILLDFYFLPGNKDGLADLAEGIAAFKRRHPECKIYAALPPLDGEGEKVLRTIRSGEGDLAAFYRKLDGFGHTEYRKSLFGNVVYYVPYVSGIRDLASNVYYDSEPGIKPHSEERVVGIGAAARSDSPNLLRFVAADHGADFCRAVGNADCESISDFGRRDWIVVGSLQYDKQPWGLSGPETLAFALNDLISPPNTAPRLPMANPGVLAGLAIAASLLSWAVFLGLFRLLRTPPSRMWLLAMASFSVGCLLVVAAYGLVWAAGMIYAQITAVLSSVALGTAIGRLHVRAVLDDLLVPTSAGTATLQSHYDVFISYSHDPENMEWVQEHVYQPLLSLRGRNGEPLRIFIDKTEIEAGMLRFRKLAQSIQESTIFLAVYSRDYFQRGYCVWEREVALRKQIKLKSASNMADVSSFTVLPIRRHNTAPPPPYDDVQHTEDPEALIKSIAARFGMCQEL